MISAHTPAGVSTVLKEYGALTRDALAKYCTPTGPRRYLYDLQSDYPKRGGKMMRPSLCIASRARVRR